MDGLLGKFKMSAGFGGSIRAEVRTLARTAVLLLPGKHDTQWPGAMSVRFETPMCSLLNTRMIDYELTYILATGITKAPSIPGARKRQMECNWDEYQIRIIDQGKNAESSGSSCRNI
jgi:hypothetical protein